MLNKNLTKCYIKKRLETQKYYTAQLSRIHEIENGERRSRIKELHNIEVDKLQFTRMMGVSRSLNQLNNIIATENWLNDQCNYWSSTIIYSKLFTITDRDEQCLVDHLQYLNIEVNYDIKQRLFELEFAFEFNENQFFENSRVSKTYFFKYDYEVSTDPCVIYSASIPPKWCTRNSNLTFASKLNPSQKGQCIQTKIVSFFDIFFTNISKIESLSTIESKRFFDMNQELNKLLSLISNHFNFFINIQD